MHGSARTRSFQTGDKYMDIDGLRNELEELLKMNPDQDAPQGFRDRFEAAVTRKSVEGDGIPVESQEAELQQIRDEAEAAAKAAGEGRATPKPKMKDTAPARQPRGGDPGPDKTRIDDHGAAAASASAEVVHPEVAASAGFLQRFGLPLGVAVVVVIAALFFFRS